MGTYKPQMPDLMEALFDTVYLLFDLIAATLFFAKSQGSTLFPLYGILTLTLCGGDAFHLVPRVKRAFRGTSERIERQLSLGLQVSSITMTGFYVLLLYIWKATFPVLAAPKALSILIWASAAVRIVICLLPQNNWYTGGNQALSLLRNGVFLITGACVAALYISSGAPMNKMAAAIVLSFGCYLPVTLFSKKHPKVGMLMIPKTCAYVWMIAMGLGLLER